MIGKLSLLKVLLAAGAILPPVPGHDRPPIPVDWRRVATPADRARLRNLRQGWIAALDRLRAAGQGKALAAEGALFDPDRVLAGAVPPPGNYRCRVFKLGANGSAMRDFTAYPALGCRIDAEGEARSFYAIGGTQRAVGLMFADNPERSVFLGTMIIGDEQTAIDYGRDANRDMVGVVERIGEQRWRLVLPYPRFESLLDVVEMVPER
ncbi:DUF4893 domain-containing protein [uncultured Sphingomonas sp.]|uniref:DUF4893 domain-containing protein n=1 Tax=uncultured Sphingomonas sp. TaxID=158754 RepID=UPI0035CB14F5